QRVTDTDPGKFSFCEIEGAGILYGHPRNRFWKVLAAVLEEEEPQTVEEKKAMLFRRGVAVYDVIEQCSIIGSSDSSIKDVVPADLGKIVGESQIQKVYTNGKTAGKLYKKYQDKEMNLPMEELPSTSPANAAYSLEKLTEIWSRAITEV
ncbi:MAG: DNA-deoxyinosine glycosylase, partial [Blautia faecicola]